MANLQEIPVVDVQIDNIQELWPTLLLAVRTSAFVAIDTELSGLGDRRKLNAKDLNDRYQALVNISKTRSIISVGLSCFRLQPAGEQRPSVVTTSGGPRYVCQTFNILVLCSEEYVVEPMSLQFLVNHNFDFNRQYAKGIPYHRGPDKEKPAQRQWLRELLTEVTAQKVPVVFHNAFVDLGFLYQSFHTNLPPSIGPFLADLTELFPGGVYDTKYVTEFRARFPASYLEYVFRKCQRDNHELYESEQAAVTISTLTYPARCGYITNLPCGILSPTPPTELCQTYAAHGWCGAGVKCTKSHDMNLILDADDRGTKSKAKKKRRKRKAQPDSSSGNPDIADTDSSPAVPDTTSSMTTVEGDSSDVITDMTSAAADSSSALDTADSELSTVRTDVTSTAPATSDSSAPLDGHDNSSPVCAGTNGPEDMAVTSDNEPPKSEDQAVPESTKPSQSRTEGHRAGFDSFMTGFIFACFVHRFSAKRTAEDELGMLEFANKVAMSGKDIPLRILQGNFVKTSKEHRLKMDKVESMVT